MSPGPQYKADCAILGGGLIGMALALELHRRGATVVVIERGRSLAGASIAAAGMLAVDDPHNPVAIRPLSRLSVAAYPSFLQHIEDLSGFRVPFQTDVTVQYLPDGASTRLSEHSLDPRQLAEGLQRAVGKTRIRLLENASISASRTTAGGSQIMVSGGTEVLAEKVVFAAGAWTPEALRTMGQTPTTVTPRKGQMLRVRLPAELPLREVHRSEHIYIVPRLVGPQAGSALIGATVEDVGFDLRLRTGAIGGLRAKASEFLPLLASETEAPLVESWTGLRPFAPDSLPMIGELTQFGHFIASGHYRNGILLAPGTAVVVADLMEGKRTGVDISAFSPQRFSRP